MPPAAASISTTRPGRTNAPRRSSTECSNCRHSCPRGGRASPRTWPAVAWQRDRVLALALHLLDRGYFRAGGEQYAEEHESYGLATLQCEHVTLRGEAVSFDYPAKSGVRRTLDIEDAEVARAVRALLRRADRTERLLVCRTASGWVDIRADDLNARFKELVGDDYSVKDLRTWHGTVSRPQHSSMRIRPESKRAIKRVESAVMKEVAEELGNTPAGCPGLVCGSSGGCRLRAGPDHREGGTAGRANPQARGGQAILGEGHPQPDPSSRQGLIRIVAPNARRPTKGLGLRRIGSTTDWPSGVPRQSWRLRGRIRPRPPSSPRRALLRPCPAGPCRRGSGHHGP